MYPFVIQHVCDMEKQNYTLYASSEEERENWRDAFEQTKALRDAWQDANKASQPKRSCDWLCTYDYLNPLVVVCTSYHQR